MTLQRRGSTTGRMTAGMQSSKRIYRKTAIVEDFDSIIEYYKTHSFYATCDKFGISRTYLNKVCEGCMFITDKRAFMPDCCRLDFPVEEWEFRGAWNRRAKK